MNTSEMVKALCNQINISQAELARRVQQTPQNFFKKIKRETLTFSELNDIAMATGAEYEQTFILQTGEIISSRNKEMLRRKPIKAKRMIGRVLWEKIETIVGHKKFDYIQPYIEELIQMNRIDVRDISVTKAVDCLIEADLDDEKICKLLVSYWNIPEETVLDMVQTIRTQIHPKNEVRKYLKNKGYSEDEIQQFIIDSHLGPKLRNNIELSKLKIEELVETLQISKGE